jgi:hypothetical protein
MASPASPRSFPSRPSSISSFLAEEGAELAEKRFVGNFCTLFRGGKRVARNERGDGRHP